MFVNFRYILYETCSYDKLLNNDNMSLAYICLKVYSLVMSLEGIPIIRGNSAFQNFLGSYFGSP